jgi:uncharacterized repeat protein (TIGR03803 family)
MLDSRISVRATAAAALLAMFSAPASGGAAQRPAAGKLTVLYAFAGGSDGANPFGGLAFDAHGDIFGTTAAGGGSANCGTVFELSPANAGYSETLAHVFGGSDGCGPNAGPIEDAHGNLYVTAASGGQYGNGTAISLAPSGNGYQNPTVYSFGNTPDAVVPEAALVDLDGTLYTTAAGGYGSPGALIGLTAKGLTGSVLFGFGGASGANPFSNLVADKAGNLYGTTTMGGKNNAGVVFRFAPSTGTETVLWNFKGGPADGAGPYTGVTLDAKGNIYGTTENGGAANKGAIFELTPKAHGYAEKILYSFSTASGYFPNAVTLKGDELLGTTLYGGPSTQCGHNGCGTLFKITTDGSKFAILHAFAQTDGQNPEGPVTVRGSTLYGTTVTGGASGRGTVFAFGP